MGVSGELSHPFVGGTIELFLFHPELPKVPKGKQIPKVIPTFTRNESCRPGRFLTVDWNLQDAE